MPKFPLPSFLTAPVAGSHNRSCLFATRVGKRFAKRLVRKGIRRARKQVSLKQLGYE